MLRSQAVSMFRQAAVILSTSVFAAGLLLATPGAISAATSTEKKVTALTYTTPTTKLQLRNAADTANATFSSGAGTDVAGTDSYTIRLYHSAISLIPTVSSKATWSCAISGDGTKVDSDCSVSGLVGGDETTIVLTVTAEDESTNDYTFTVDTYATDATLSDLVINNGTLAPTFNAGVTSYSATTGQATIDIDPTANSGTATVVCKKGSSTYTNCDGDLAVGSNAIVITVTAADGLTKKTYTVSITRVADTNNEIMSLSLSHGGLLTAGSTSSSFTRTNFSPTTVDYDLTSNDKDVDITVDLKNEDGTFDCADTNLASSSPDADNASGDTCTFDLTGANADTGFTITITVDPEGVAGTNKVYTFTVRLHATVVSDEIPALTPAGSTVAVGKSITFDPTAATLAGDFTNETRVMYQWYLCADDVALGVEDPDTVPADCVAKTSAVAATYTASSSDIGKHVIGALIGQPGSVLAYSASKEVVGAPGLKNSSTPPAPTEAGLVGAEIGSSISLENITTGDFTGITNVGSQVDFQWYRCTSAATSALTAASLTTPTGCSKISGATTSSYTPATSLVAASNDSGKFLRARLILSPSAGAEYMIYTRTTNKVYGPAVATGGPSAPAAPTTLVDTKTLTANNGSWSGTPALDTTVATNYSYQWFACGAVVSLASNTDPSTVNDRRGNPKCEAIPGEVSKTFVVTNEWCGKYLLVGVQVDNTDFRFKGGTSDMRYSATSSSAVAGSACN